MDQRSVRVVVGQADRARGALRDVLTDDGFLVVGEAATVGDLARVLRDAQPDVIVLDDSIGVAAAQLATELSPRAKLVVIWPAAVMPIAGAARVDPGEVGMALSATVGLVAGLSGLGSIERPEWVDKVRKDPAALREKLASSGAAPVRPSVTELQRRGQRLHPSPGAGRRRSSRSARAAAVAAGALSLASTDTAPGEGAVPAAGRAMSETDVLVSRRIGMIALGGAAVAGALMIALSFGPNRSPAVITAVRFIPPISTPTAGPPPTTTDPTPGDGGQNPGPTTPPSAGGPATPPAVGGGTTPISPPTAPPPAGGAGGPGGTGGGGGGAARRRRRGRRRRHGRRRHGRIGSAQCARRSCRLERRAQSARRSARSHGFRVGGTEPAGRPSRPHEQHWWRARSERTPRRRPHAARGPSGTPRAYAQTVTAIRGRDRVR